MNSHLTIQKLIRIETQREVFQKEMNTLCGIKTTLSPVASPLALETINDVLKLLSNFPDCVGYSYNRRGKTIIDLKQEDGVQDMIYFMLKPSIPDLIPEQPVAASTRQYTIQDFRSQRLSLVIEAKRIRGKQHGKTIKTELHDDIGNYKNDPHCKSLIFFIYDPDNFIESPSGLRATIEGVHKHNFFKMQVYCIIQR